jgi:hypothetical protein
VIAVADEKSNLAKLKGDYTEADRLLESMIAENTVPPDHDPAENNVQQGE